MIKLYGNAIVGQSGGPTAAINATLSGVIRGALECDRIDKIYGAINGIEGVLDRRFCLLNDIIKGEDDLSLLENTPAAALGSCRKKLPKDMTGDNLIIYEQILDVFRDYNIRYFFYIGGNDSMDTIKKLSDYAILRGHPTKFLGVPKTIDNDIWGTDITFGFDTAVNIATEAIDRLHSTASSHKRVMVVEVMGHHAGWIALYAGMAGGADVILLPELGFDMDQINEVILDRARRGKPYSIVVVAEGIETPDKERPSVYVTRVIEEATGIESRDTVLGYIQRGGSPTPFDRNLSTRMGGHATELIAGARFGRMVTLKGNEISSAPLEEIAGKLKLVTEEHDLVVQGKRMGICFG